MLMASNERFRNEFATQILEILPQDQAKSVLNVFDAILKDYDIERRSTEIIVTDDTPEIVKRYLSSKAIAGLSLKTVYQYKETLVTFFKTMQIPFTNIRPDDIRAYLNYYLFQIGRSKGYVNQIRVRLNTFFQWLVDNEYIIRNPCSTVDRIKVNKKKKEAFSSMQIEELRWDATQIDIRTRAIIDFFYSTGMRVGELVQVKLEDIDWNERSVFIRHGKGDKERFVYFNAESELTLRKYLETRKGESEYLFSSLRKPYHGIQVHAVQNALKKVGKMAAYHVHPHKFRRSFASHSIGSGMPLPILQNLMGHSKPETTMDYVEQYQDNIKHEHQRIYA